MINFVQLALAIYQEDLTDPSGAKNRKFAAKVYVPRFNRDNGNMMKKAIVEASNI